MHTTSKSLRQTCTTNEICTHHSFHGSACEPHCAVVPVPDAWVRPVLSSRYGTPDPSALRCLHSTGGGNEMNDREMWCDSPHQLECLQHCTHKKLFRAMPFSEWCGVRWGLEVVQRGKGLQCSGARMSPGTEGHAYRHGGNSLFSCALCVQERRNCISSDDLTFTTRGHHKQNCQRFFCEKTIAICWSSYVWRMEVKNWSMSRRQEKWTGTTIFREATFQKPGVGTSIERWNKYTLT